MLLKLLIIYHKFLRYFGLLYVKKRYILFNIAVIYTSKSLEKRARVLFNMEVIYMDETFFSIW